MPTLRSYRLVPALLALSLVLTAATPLIHHSCGMAEVEMATKPCCKDKAGHHDIPAMPEHDGAMAHGDASDAMPCHEAPEPPAPCPDDGSSLHDACCFTTDAPTAPTPERIVSPTALVALVAAFVPPTPPLADAHAPSSSGSPPTAPVALHVLYESFLI